MSEQPKKILHVSSVDPVPNSGMGRVSYYWKIAFENMGYEFIHIGLEHIGYKVHPLFRAWRFRKYILQKKINADLILAHEPLAGFLKFKNIPLISFSHGVEERGWKVLSKYFPKEVKLTSRLIPFQLRFYSNDRGFKLANLVFLLNKEDQKYLINKKQIPATKTIVIRNGLYPVNHFNSESKTNKEIVFLFNASWLKRKGIDLLVRLFSDLFKEKVNCRLIVAGTNLSKEYILSYFDEEYNDKIVVIPSFDAEKEFQIYNEANVFLLPSYYEGQSLALLQAMAFGLCPIVTDNCGQTDLIQHNENGLLFATGDYTCLKKLVELCISNPEMVNKLGKKAHDTVKDFSWEIIGNDVVRYCESILNT